MPPVVVDTKPPPSPRDPPALGCERRDPGPAPLRLLSPFEYENTIADLMGLSAIPTDLLPPEEKKDVFSDALHAPPPGRLLVDRFAELATRFATEAVGRGLDRLVPCASAGDAACARRFLETWGQRAWRRPLTADEGDALLRLYGARAAEPGAGFAAGLKAVIEVMLQAPQFLYRLEVPASGTTAAPLSSWEMASRLSYLLWGSMPDEILLAAARADRLRAPEDIVAQARRLLDDKRARRVTARFFSDWLELEKLAGTDKDRKLFPGFDGTQRPLWRREVETFTDALGWDPAQGLRGLLTAPVTFLNGPLATFYGVKGPSGDAFVRVDLDPTKRAGLLTTGGVLANFAAQNQTNPVLRGKLVRERLLCQHLPSPPDGVEIKAPELDTQLTTRERFAQHSADPSCAGCHRLMDPVGLAFEGYDAVGRWRDEENGKRLDLSGELVGSDSDGRFVGAVELTGRLASSAEVKRCYAVQWFRFSFAREETAADACTLKEIERRLDGTSGDLRALLLAIVESDAFRLRRSGGQP